MARGRQANEGDTNTSANGYHYTRTKDRWRLTHHLIVEEKLGRPLKPNEMVKFVDGDKTNLDPKNIYVIIKKTSSARTRLARIEARIVELEAERDALIKEIESRANV